MPPIVAASCSRAFRCPSAESSTIASTGKNTFTSWFQMVKTTSASVVRARSNPHPRSIAKVIASPTASPPGATFEIAVEASDTVSELRRPSPGSAAIHGGPKVTMLRTATPVSTAASRQVRRERTSQTAE